MSGDELRWATHSWRRDPLTIFPPPSADSLALAALEDYVSEDDEDDARWNDEEGNGRRKKRKMAKREGTTLSEEA